MCSRGISSVFQGRPRDLPNCARNLTLYCIVSIHLYSASFSAHQSEALPVPREKSAALRERKEALGTPVNEVDRVEGRSWFQSEGPMIAKYNPTMPARRTSLGPLVALVMTLSAEPVSP